MFWPFTVWIPKLFSKILKILGLQPRISKEQYFLTVGQKNFGNKIPFLKWFQPIVMALRFHLTKHSHAISHVPFKELCMWKVHIFWEGHKILQNLHYRLDWHYNGQIYGGDFAKLAFSEYMNFKIPSYMKVKLNLLFSRVSRMFLNELIFKC